MFTRMVLESLPIVGVQDLKLPRKFPDRLVEALRKIDAHAKELCATHVLLFGSAARGEALFGSDLDILLLTDAEAERPIRLLVDKFEISDEGCPIPVQVTVRKLDRFLDPEEDPTGFHRTIQQDVKLLRKYHTDS